MTYRVIITPQAELDLRTTYRHIRTQSRQAAQEWLRHARQSAKSLARHPQRCPLAPESTAFHQPIRELLFGKRNRGTYRLLFLVSHESVYVLHVRHGSMLPL